MFCFLFFQGDRLFYPALVFSATKHVYDDALFFSCFIAMQKLKSVVFVNFFTVFVWKKGSAGNLSAAMAKRKATYYSGRFEMREEWVCASPEEYDKGRLRIDYDQIIAKRGQLHRRHRPNFVFKRFFILEQVEPIAIDLDSNGTAVVGVGQCCYSCCEKPVFEMFQHKMSCFEFLIPVSRPG